MTPPLPRWIPLAVALLAMLGGSGSCRAIETSRARQAMKSRLDPLVGKNMNKVYASLGPPARRRRRDGQEVWSYFQSYGSRTRSLAAHEAGVSSADELDSYIHGYDDADFRRDEFSDIGYSRGDYTRSAHSRGAPATWEAYDSFSIFFRDGVVVRWSGRVQR